MEKLLLPIEKAVFLSILNLPSHRGYRWEKIGVVGANMKRCISCPMKIRWVALFLIILCVSCAKNAPLNPVEGKVLYKGKEANGAVVTFHPKGGDPITAIRPVGLTGEDGTFKLTTGLSAGAPAGEYTVTLIWPKEVGTAKKNKEPDFNRVTETFDFLGGTYADAGTSKIKVEIKRGETKLEPFKLE